jgi:hypothetical protein
MAIAIYVLYRVRENQPIYLEWFGTPTLAHEEGINKYAGDYKIHFISVPDTATMDSVEKKARKEISKLKV